jgi:hypothetical protein
MPRNDTGLAAGLRAMAFAALLALVGGALAGPVAAQTGCPEGWNTVSGSDESGMTMCQRDGPDGTVEMAYATELEEEARGIAEDGRSKGQALKLFYYSMGWNSNGTPSASPSCMTCFYIASTITALATFSAALFSFFQGFFVSLGPLLLASWVGFWVIRLAVAGGEGADDFFRALIKKMTLFTLLWGVLFSGYGMMGPHLPESGQTGATYFAGPVWHLSGPEVLRYSYAVSADVREKTAESLLATAGTNWDSRPFLCLGLNEQVRVLVRNDSLNPTVHAVTQTVCVMERVHSLGIAASVGLITGVWQSAAPTVGGVFKAFVGTFTGVSLLAIFGLSAVWFVFLVLDVAVKAFVVAGFSPLLALAALFQPTRGIAWAGVRLLLAAPVVAIAMGMITILGFFLILNTVNVYENTRLVYGLVANMELQPLEAVGTVERFAEFLERSQLESHDPNFIPFDLFSMWIVYLILVGLGLTVLGRKVLTICENIMGMEPSAQMADNARSMAIKGAALTAGVAALGVGLAAAPLGAAAGGVGNKVGGMVGDRLTKVGAAARRGAAASFSPFGFGGKGGDGQ